MSRFIVALLIDQRVSLVAERFQIGQALFLRRPWEPSIPRVGPQRGEGPTPCLHGAGLGAARARQPRRLRTLVAPWLWRYVRTRLSVETIYLALYMLPLVLPARLEGTDARSAGHGFTKKLGYVPARLRNTLTDDRGKEMAEYERLAQRLASQVFFAYPHSHWQRGINESTNGLLRSTSYGHRLVTPHPARDEHR